MLIRVRWPQKRRQLDPVPASVVTPAPLSNGPRASSCVHDPERRTMSDEPGRLGFTGQARLSYQQGSKLEPLSSRL